MPESLCSPVKALDLRRGRLRAEPPASGAQENCAVKERYSGLERSDKNKEIAGGEDFSYFVEHDGRGFESCRCRDFSVT